jgi:transcriptional regulator with XRE-family HTH domain
MTSDEAAYVDLRLKFSGAVRDFRKKKRLTQIELAELLHQSRVAKVEAADESVSLDLLIRSLLALGATDQDLAKEIGGKGSRVP